jgi:predicted permease
MTVTANDTLPRLLLGDGSRGMRIPDNAFLKPIFVLLAMTGLLLLLACVNIANLLLARGTERQREMSVRLAMGAGRSRLVRQMLVESILLAAIGGLGGLALAYLGRNAVPSLLSNPWQPLAFQVRFDWSVFAFCAAATLATGLLCGLVPALAAMRANVSARLKEAGPSATRRRKGWSGRGAVAFQITLSTLLVICASLFVRTLVALNSVDPGFRADHLLLFAVNPPAERYGPGKDIQLHMRLEQEFAAIPGVQSVAPAWVPYIADSVSGSRIRLEGQSAVDGEGKPVRIGVDFNVVGNNFFSTLGIPVLQGRGFGPQDTATSRKVAVINQALANSQFPGVNPIGRRFLADEDAGWIEIIGVCGDNRYRNLRDSSPPQYFIPYVQGSDIGGMTYAIRTNMHETEIVPALRHAIQRADRDLPIVEVRTQQQQIAATMSMERMLASLISAFGILALALACVGIYGVMAYSVANRTNEIGIRLALGAVPRQVLRMILREATWISLVGVLAGVAIAFALARLVQSMLFGLKPADPISLIGGAALLIAVSLAASWLPASRAATVEPIEALRHE